jgi:hypothetical protein
MDEGWIVKRQSGESWGVIRRLIVDPTTRQIVCADAVLNDTGRLVRVPWNHFEFNNGAIILNRPDRQVQTRVLNATGAGLPETVTLQELHQDLKTQLQTYWS